MGPFGVSGTGCPLAVWVADWPLRFWVTYALAILAFATPAESVAAASLVRTPIHTPPLLAGQFDVVGRGARRPQQF
jgi:hypothetical protein